MFLVVVVGGIIFLAIIWTVVLAIFITLVIGKEDLVRLWREMDRLWEELDYLCRTLAWVAFVLIGVPLVAVTAPIWILPHMVYTVWRDGRRRF